MNRICIDPELENRGHSGGIVFRDEEGCVSMCSTNEGGLPKIPVLLVDFDKLDVQFKAGATEYSLWADLWVESRKKPEWRQIALDFMWKFLLRHMTKDLLVTIAKQSYANGVKDGREAKRLEIVKALSD